MFFIVFEDIFKTFNWDLQRNIYGHKLIHLRIADDIITTDDILEALHIPHEIASACSSVGLKINQTQNRQNFGFWLY